MDYKYIEQLIGRYFDCETTIAEERILKAFFSQNEVPEHLRQYAALFVYEEAKGEAGALDDAFDERVLDRLAKEGDAPVLRVKIQRLTFADRIRPFYRAAAAVAIVVLIGGSMHHAYVKNTIEPISQFGTGSDEAMEVVDDTMREQEIPNLFFQQGEKVAITNDTVRAVKK